MKLNGVFGKGTGKVGNSVWAVSGGVQIVRPYNPNVSNPNTDAQVAQRAKFKLMSQIAADLARYIAIPKKGLSSARNQFVSKNIYLCSWDSGAASCELPGLQLTAGASSIPQLDVTAANGHVQVKLALGAPNDVKTMVYVLCKVDNTNQLSVVASSTVQREGGNATFDKTFDISNGDYVVYGYGLKDTAFAQGVNYENYYIESGEEIANLATYNRTANGSADFTATVGASFSLE